MEEWLGKNYFLPLWEWNRLTGESCRLLREGVQLPGENCFLPQEEGEQWPVYGWEIDLDFDCLLDCLLS